MAIMTSIQQPPLCKHWARSKICLYHSKGKCKFAHPEDYEPASSSASNTHAFHAATGRHRSAGGRLQTRNDTRVAKFRSFIASHESIDLRDCNVLDVAGGKGEMAFQLLNLSDAATCHVIDPRPLSLTRFRKRLRKGYYHRSASVLHAKDVVRTREDAERPVEHLRCFFSHELWQQPDGPDHHDKKLHEAFVNNCRGTQAWSWPPAGGSDEHAECSANANCQCDNDDDAAAVGEEKTETETPSFELASLTVRRANLIVGMHPDQAVDAIVDAALDLNVSFFVVPCCTYSREFPHRRVTSSKNGDDKVVTTYDELLDYLQSKSPDIERHVLPFEGKNVCLYRIVT